MTWRTGEPTTRASFTRLALRAVFDNKTLAAIAEARPATLVALGAIKVGHAQILLARS